MDVEGHQDFKLKIYIYIFKKDKRKDTPTVKLFVFNRTYKTVFDSNSLWPTAVTQPLHFLVGNSSIFSICFFNFQPFFSRNLSFWWMANNKQLPSFSLAWNCLLWMWREEQRWKWSVTTGCWGDDIFRWYHSWCHHSWMPVATGLMMKTQNMPPNLHKGFQRKSRLVLLDDTETITWMEQNAFVTREKVKHNLLWQKASEDWYNVSPDVLWNICLLVEEDWTH